MTEPTERTPRAPGLRFAKLAAALLAGLIVLTGIAAEVRVRRENRAVAVIESTGGIVARQPRLPLVWHLRLLRLLGERHLPLFTTVRGIRFERGAPATDLRMALRSAARLRRLEWVDLSHTHVDDAALEELAGACCLRVLDLRFTQLDNRALAPVTEASGLTTLLLSAAGLTGSDWQRLLTLPHLAQLQLDANDITIDASGMPDGRMAPLRTLSVARTAIDGEGLARIVGWSPDLVEIDLSGTRIGDIDLPLLSRLRNLDTVNLQDTLVSSDGVAALARQPGLRLIVAPEAVRRPDRVGDPLVIYR